jgi:hypothetical protein
MKKCLIGLILLFFQNIVLSQDKIIISHIGESDKPFQTIILSNEQVSNEDPNLVNIIVSDCQFDSISTLIECAFDSICNKTNGMLSYGTFKIKISNSKNIEICVNREKAIRLYSILYNFLYENHLLLFFA